MPTKFQLKDQVCAQGCAIGVIVGIVCHPSRFREAAPRYSVVLGGDRYHLTFAESDLSLYITPHHFQE
jgi:hypothetical protein